VVNIIPVNYPTPGDMAPRDISLITDLIIHHSDGSPNQTPLEIDQEHRGNGWSMIGYNYVVGPSGQIWKGRPDEYVPAAAEGDNTNSVDVCLLGDFQPGTEGYISPIPTAQLQALRDLAVYLHQKYKTIERTIGHRDVSVLKNEPENATACPGDELYAQLEGIRAYAHAHVPI
jgi:hypothetical protein